MTVDGEALIDDGVAAVLFIVFQVSHPQFSIFSYHVSTNSKIMPAGPLIDTATALHFSCLSPTSADCWACKPLWWSGLTILNQGFLGILQMCTIARHATA